MFRKTVKYSGMNLFRFGGLIYAEEQLLAKIVRVFNTKRILNFRSFKTIWCSYKMHQQVLSSVFVSIEKDYETHW